MPILKDWTAASKAVWWEKVGDPSTSVQTISLRHPTYPAEAEWDDDDTETLKKIVATYLSKVGSTLDLPELVDPSSDDFTVHLAWLKLPKVNGSLDPDKSFWLTRYGDPVQKTEIVDRTMVFIASEAWRAGDPDTIVGSRSGMRVVAHLAQGQSGSWQVRITSVARSIALPQALEAHALQPSLVQGFYAFMFSPSNFANLKPLIRSSAGLSDETPLAINGMRAMPVPEDRAIAEVYATASRPDDGPRALAYALTLQFAFDQKGQLGKPTVERVPLVANAAPPVKADLFAQDPASKAGLGGLINARPNRSRQRLDRFKDNAIDLDGINLDINGKATLLDDHGLVNVLQSRLVKENANESATQIVDPALVRHPRTSGFVELSAYQHVRARFGDGRLRPLFDTIIKYGLSPSDYFLFATKPLLVRHRAGIFPGPGKDGKTVNAQVDFDPPSSDLIGPKKSWSQDNLKPLQVRFALADVKRTTSRHDALGLATDPRWSWHEYCHVLLAGRTGKLELHFAHSAGDALAAIVADPWSKLADYRGLRGYTFPWVYLHRRHDRSVYMGWSWSGRRHRPARFPAANCNCRHKGYESEQILSTSLFMLYRALGGDTVRANGRPNRPIRQRAADYVVYLILRAIGLMPPHHVGTVETPDQFVTTLIEADIGTLPVTTGPLRHRVGGWAHKVVRWAFEAQGLYATSNPLDVVDAPGLPPEVDIFIDTSRPDSEGGFPRGGYMPVSLDWGDAAAPGRWHAAPDALAIAANQIQVEVRNRGQSAATGVKVAVWYIVWPNTSASPPRWSPATWTRIDEIGPRSVLPQGSESFGPFALPAYPSGTRLLILAIADCVDDHANTSAASSLPCSNYAVPIVDLVAGDNNLGLRLYVVP